MARQFLPLLFVFIAMTTVDAEALRRRRRQATTPPSIVVPCPIRCAWSRSQAWAKAISFETPSANMIPDQSISNTNDTFGVMCTIYRSYTTCLEGCPSEYADIVSASPPVSKVCTDRKSDFDTYLPCFVNNTRTFQRVCQKENEQLLASAVRLNSPQQSDARATNEFCSAANRQAFCILPTLSQTCGADSSNLVRSIVNASMASVRASFTASDKTAAALYPQCADYLRTIANGISTPSTSGNEKMANSNQTVVDDVSTNSSQVNTTEKVLRRDDANGPTYAAGERMAGSVSPRFLTTPSSGGTRIDININKMYLFVASSALFILFL